MKGKGLIVLVSAITALNIANSQSFDSTGSNRLYVTPSASGSVGVPGYGDKPEGAIVATFSAKVGAVTTFYACVVKAGGTGGTPVGGTRCPTNTIYMVTASGVYHDGGGNDGG